ncbi:MAG: MFS transporter [Proteobacteria bacterium]|nr:MFS transporter [Pseudomonadota bacterium]
MPAFLSARQILSFRLAPLYGALFLTIGFQLPFWPVWLEFKGLNLQEIGIVLAAPVWVKVVFTPLIAGTADHFGKRKAPLVILAIICFGLFNIYFLVDGFWEILIVALLIGIFFSSFTPLADNLVLTLSQTHQIDYARIRLWGSITFILASVFGGQLLTGRSPDFIPVMITASLLLLVLCSLFLPEIEKSEAQPTKRGLRRLLRNKGFLGFVVMAGLVQASHAVLYSSGTLQWQSQGISDAAIGFLWAEGVFVEILLFAFAKRLFVNFSPVALLSLGAIAGLLRWVAMAFEPGLETLVVVQAFHGLTFAAAHLGAMRFIAEKVPQEVSARAQGLYSAISIGIIMGGGLFLSGFLYQEFASFAYFYMAAACLLALLIAVYLRKLKQIVLL